MYLVSQEKATELLRLLQDHDVKLRFKENGYDVWWHRLAALATSAMFTLLRKVTGGKFTRTFDEFTTTFGTYIYFGSPEKTWRLDDYTIYATLRHELIHVLQEREFGPWKFRFLYLLWLPAVFTYRATFEYTAYLQQLIAEFEETGDIADATVEWLVETFAGPSYFFMYPFKDKLRRQLQKDVALIKQGVIKGLWPYKTRVFSNTTIDEDAGSNS